jgi:hypothetical protein
MNHRRTLILAALLVVAAAAPAQLNVIKLKSGDTVEGYVVEEATAFVKIETLDGKTVKRTSPPRRRRPGRASPSSTRSSARSTGRTSRRSPASPSGPRARR